MNTHLRSQDIHAQLRDCWPSVLRQLGIGDVYLRNKHGPCPACGGHDRYRFDNRKGRGDFYCNGCGAGDGFQLLMRVHGWQFAEARRRVLEVASFSPSASRHVASRPAIPIRTSISKPPSRVTQMRREVCNVELCDDAITYLGSRGLWPMPAGCSMRAHPTVAYWDEGGSNIGRFSALVAEIRDIDNDFVTLHVTYLERGRKLTTYEPRKILSPLTGRQGCAVRLAPLSGNVLGIAEGIETALSAMALDGLPVWAALNAALLGRFQPPAEVQRLVIFADRDTAGLGAATKLMERMQGAITLEVRTPAAPAKDWNDVLLARTAKVSVPCIDFDVTGYPACLSP